METISAFCAAFCAGNSPVTKGQWRGALMFSLICAWINAWLNNREAGDLRRHRAHYDVTVMQWTHSRKGTIFHFYLLKNQRIAIWCPEKELKNMQWTYNVMIFVKNMFYCRKHDTIFIICLPPDPERCCSNFNNIWYFTSWFFMNKILLCICISVTFNILLTEFLLTKYYCTFAFHIVLRQIDYKSPLLHVTNNRLNIFSKP